MYPDEDRFQHAFEQREERRRRLTRAVRGWLRSERCPRLTTLGMLLGCALWSVLVDIWLERVGFGFRPYRWSTSVFAAWPMFLLLLRWRAGVEARRCDVVSESWDRFVSCDDAAERRPAPGLKSPARISAENELSRGIGKIAGQPGGVFIIMALIAITVGTWLAWDLIRLGPSLLTDTMIDGVIVPARPQMAAGIASEPWQRNLASSTFFHFIGMALMAIVVAIFWPPMLEIPL